jgi:hypothetical protein
MSDWERLGSEKQTGGWVGTVLQILTLGIAGPNEHWEVTYKNRQNGQLVKGVGTTEQEADARARALCA